MSLMTIAAERSGAARMFFDLRATRSVQEDERRIEAALERADALAQDIEEQRLRHAA